MLGLFYKYSYIRKYFAPEKISHFYPLWAEIIGWGYTPPPRGWSFRLEKGPGPWGLRGRLVIHILSELSYNSFCYLSAGVLFSYKCYFVPLFLFFNSSKLDSWLLATKKYSTLPLVILYYSFSIFKLIKGEGGLNLFSGLISLH